MQFGRVNDSLLNNIDFALPDPADNQLVLPGQPAANISVYIGAPRWGMKEWVGPLYPKGTKEANYLEEYPHHFNCIEFNATHYKIYDPITIGKWNARVNRKDFKFCPKVPQSISHYSSLVNAQDQTTAFLEGILALEENLGPIFLQLGENFSPNRRDNLFTYLQSLPTDLQWYVELRHPDWFANPAFAKELFDTLRQLKIGAVITDTAGRRDCVHMHLPLPGSMVRFVGNSLHPTDYKRMDEWVDRIDKWVKNGLQELYFFMHMADEMAYVDATVYFIDKLQEVCGISVPKPVFQPKQQSLF